MLVSPVVLALNPNGPGKKMYKAGFFREASLGGLVCRKKSLPDSDGRFLRYKAKSKMAAVRHFENVEMS